MKTRPASMVEQEDLVASKAIGHRAEALRRVLELGSEIPDRVACTPEALAQLACGETDRWVPVIKVAIGKN